MVGDTEPLAVGVIGVGSMGQHHARVYRELPSAHLVGVADADEQRAREVATELAVHACSIDELLDQVDAVSVVVPTEFHYDVAMDCVDAGVGILIEKPVADDLDRAKAIQDAVRQAGVTAQVGHIERFNPAIRKVGEVIDDLEIVSLRAQRLGPPPNRSIPDSAILDLMIHDLDIILGLVGERPQRIHAVGVDENAHAAALLEFPGGCMASLTASRRTQRKIRRLEITAADCYIDVDYMDQSVEVHRDSAPEYINEDGGVRFREQSIVERPRVETREPLRIELESFVDAVRYDREPVVSIEDGIRALATIQEIERHAMGGRIGKKVSIND